MAATAPTALTPGQKLWRECVRPFRKMTRRLADRPSADGSIDGRQPLQGAEAAAALPNAGILSFHPLDCTVEPEGAELIKQLVIESQAHTGPIIEIGTLLGVTATQIALAKAPAQQIIAVDNFCWNPWGLPPDVQHALATQILQYLIQTGDVELLRVDKNQFFEEYAGPAPAMVFLDAMHDYEETKKDIEWARRVGAKIISGHDYCDQFPGVVQIVDECGGPQQLGGTVWSL